MTTKNNKKWLVNINVNSENLLLQFDTKEKQLSFVEKIKKTVDNCVWALDPVELVSEEILKQKIK